MQLASELHCYFSASLLTLLVIAFGTGTLAASGPGLRVLVPLKAGFKEFVSWQEIIADNGTTTYKFDGFSVEVFLQAINRLPSSPAFHFVPVGDEKSTPSYDDMVGRLQRREADAIVADLTILKERMDMVDFTMPYIQSSLMMITTVRYTTTATMWDFLQPFASHLWVAIGVSFVATGLVLYFLENKNPEFSKHAHKKRLPDKEGSPRVSEFSHGQSFHPSTTLCENADSDSVCSNDQSPAEGVSRRRLLLNAYWFTSLCIFFSQQESVKTHLGRIVTVIWLFMVLIFSSSYTASLASILAVQQPYPKIDSLDALLKSGARVGYQEGSFVKGYLRQLGFPFSRLDSYSSELEFAEALRNGTANGGVIAILDEVAYTDILLKSECSFTSVGDQLAYFGGFGFAFAKNSNLTDEVSKGILALAQEGVLQRLRNGFLGAKASNCNTVAPYRLQLGKFGGLFSILGGVYAMCVVLRVILRHTHLAPIYKAYKDQITAMSHHYKKQQEPPLSSLTGQTRRHNARVAADPAVVGDPSAN